MSQVFNTNVEINGADPDVVQLTVEGATNQIGPLQSWGMMGNEMARVQADGRIQSGSLNTGAGATGDAQIEVFRHEDATAVPKRGLNITGAIKDALTSVVSWSVHELFLKGTAGVRSLHSALRVRIVNENTGTTNTNGELRAGEFEVSNEGGGSGNPIPVVVGLDVRVTNEDTGHVETAYGVRVAVSDVNTNGITDAFALHATGGRTRLDEVLELRGDLATAPSAESDVAKMYVKSDGKLYAKLSTGPEYILSIAPAPQSGDEVKFLRGDATWAAPSGGSSLPLGTIVDYAGTGDPSGGNGEWLLCDGRAISRSSYANLFTLIGTTFGTGDGSATFNIPDLRGRTSIGPDNMGTAQGNANRVPTGDELGEAGGNAVHTLTINEMPSHTHIQNAHAHTSPVHQHSTSDISIPVREDSQMTPGTGVIPALASNNSNSSRLVSVPNTSAVAVTINSSTATNQNTGGGAAHNNIQPYQVVNKIILVAL